MSVVSGPGAGWTPTQVVCSGSYSPWSKCNSYIQNVFGALYYIRYVFTSANQAFFLWKGEECLMHPLPSIKRAPFTHNLHSECAHHLCCLLLPLLLPVIQMRSVTRSLVAKQNVLLPDLPWGKSTYFLVSKTACSCSLHILIAKWVIYM